MTAQIVDRDRCLQCGMCATLCQYGLISLDSPEGYPVLSDAAQARCLHCGHCEAACPQGALTVPHPEILEASRQSGKVTLSPEQIGLYMRNRRSVRFFQERLAEHDTFTALLDIVRFAPSAANGQPVQWVVVETPQEVRRLTQIGVDWLRTLPADAPARAVFSEDLTAFVLSTWDQGVDPICRSAPHLVLAHAPRRSMMPVVDGTIALTYLELAAPAFGLGTCWAGFFYLFLEASPQLREAVGIPAENIPLGGLMMGYPRYESHRIPARNRADVQWM